MPGPLKRRFFPTNEMRHTDGSISYDVIRSYAPNGLLGSGRHWSILSSRGDLVKVEQKDAQAFVNALKERGYKDLRDPGYDK